MRQTLITLMLCGSLSFGAAATPQASTHGFSIKRVPLAKALISFARQADVSMVLPRLSYRDGKSRRLNGELTIEAGLTRLLQHSDFTFEHLPSGAIRVFRKPAVVLPVKIESARLSLVMPRIEEIHVSTTRRIESTQKLPYSIFAMSGTAIEDIGVTYTESLIRHVSSVSATNRGRGRNKLVMRGLSDGAFSGSTQTLVSTYLDYSRLTYSTPEPNLKLVDIEQVEFLRGPHGTLYGSGALGGLYRVVTRKPNFDAVEIILGTALSLSEHGGFSEGVDAVFNFPLLNDKAAVRMVGYYEHDTGYIDDSRLGLQNINSANTFGGRALLAVKLGADWEMSLGVVYQKHNAEDSNYFNADLDDFVRNNFLQEPYQDELLQLTGGLEAHFSWADLVSSTAWTARNIDSVLDATLAIPALTEIDTLVPSPFVEDRWVRTVTHETHIASTSGSRVEWLVGLFWSHRDARVDTSITVPGSAAEEDLGPTDLLYAETLTYKMTEVAGFGEFTYFLTEKLSLTAGGRWFKYDILASSTLDDVGTDPVSVGEGDQHGKGFTSKFVISYHADADTLVYVQGSEGYRVGGINLTGPAAREEAEEDEEEEEDETEEEEEEEHALLNFDPDNIFNLELGAKYTRMNGRLVINTAVFHTWWQQIQSDQYSDSGLPIIGNVGDARNFGAEVDLTYWPSLAWRMRLNASWNQSKLTQITPGFGAELGANKNSRLPGAPIFSGGASLSYAWNTAQDWQATLTADYSYTGSSTLLFNSIDDRQTDSYHMANLALDLHRNNWRVRVSIDNLFGSAANSFSFGNPFSFAAINQITPVHPRSAGIEIRWAL